MTHMKLSRYVGRRHYYSKRFFILVCLSLKTSFALPHLIDAFLEISGIIIFRQIFFHLCQVSLSLFLSLEDSPLAVNKKPPSCQRTDLSAVPPLFPFILTGSRALIISHKTRKQPSINAFPEALSLRLPSL